MRSSLVPLPLLQVGSLIVVSSALVWLYWPVITQTINQVATDEDFSFGLLLPAVSAYIVYLKWPKIRRQSWRPSWWGLTLIFAGIVLDIFGELIAIFYLPPVSFLVMLVGVLWLLAGWNLVRLVLFPIFLLFLMIPLPSLLVQQVTFKLQLISSRLAAEILWLLGIPVFLAGNVLDLGVRQLQVVNACSGLRYILSLFALGVIFCYFYQRRLWKASLLIVALIPPTILANAFRVALMGIFPALQEGFLHSFSGWCIFVVCFAFLALVNWTLNKVWPEPTAHFSLAPAANNPAKTTVSRFNEKFYFLYPIAGLLLIMATNPFYQHLTQAPPTPLLQSFDKFPLQIGSWHGSRSFLEPAMAKAVGTDAYFDATYGDNQNPPISLWIGYFESQNKKIEGRIHSPLICLPGSGWKILESRIVEVNDGLSVRYLLMEKDGSRQIVYYWYFQRGRWMASEYPMKFFMGLDGLLKRRNDGAIVRLITPVSNRDVTEARQRLNLFLRPLANLLPQFISQ